jgi:hypothetical protein
LSNVASPAADQAHFTTEATGYVAGSLGLGYYLKATCVKLVELGLREMPIVKRLSDPILIVLSTPRSGSSLLTLMLNANRELYSGQELHLLPFFTMGERREACPVDVEIGLLAWIRDLLRLDEDGATTWAYTTFPDACPIWRVFEVLQQYTRPRIMVEKSPTSAEELCYMEHADAIFGDVAKYVHLIRHPYACIDSWIQLLSEWFGAEGVTWEDMERGYRHVNVSAQHFLKLVDDRRKLVLTYEVMVSDAKTSTQDICQLVGVEWSDAMLYPYDSSESLAPFMSQRTDQLAATDPKLFARKSVDPKQADKWRKVNVPRPLDVLTVNLAEKYGYSFEV